MEGVIHQLWSFQDSSVLKKQIEIYLEENNSEMVAEFSEQGQLRNIKSKNPDAAKE